MADRDIPARTAAQTNHRVSTPGFESSGQGRLGKGLAEKVPDHGARLEPRRTAQPVDEVPQTAVRSVEPVPAFEIDVVGKAMEKDRPRQNRTGIGPVHGQGELALPRVIHDERVR